MLKFTNIALLIIGLAFGLLQAIMSPSVGQLWLDTAHQVHVLLIWVIQSLGVAALLKYVFEDK